MKYHRIEFAATPEVAAYIARNVCKHVPHATINGRYVVTDWRYHKKPFNLDDLWPYALGQELFTNGADKVSGIEAGEEGIYDYVHWTVDCITDLWMEVEDWAEEKWEDRVSRKAIRDENISKAYRDASAAEKQRRISPLNVKWVDDPQYRADKNHGC